LVVFSERFGLRNGGSADRLVLPIGRELTVKLRVARPHDARRERCE